MSDFYTKNAQSVNDSFNKGFYDSKAGKCKSATLKFAVVDDVAAEVSIAQVCGGNKAAGNVTFKGLLDDKNSLKIGVEGTRKCDSRSVKATGELKFNQLDFADVKVAGTFERAYETTTPAGEGQEQAEPETSYKDDKTFKVVVDAPKVGDVVDLHADFNIKKNKWSAALTPVFGVCDCADAALKLGYEQDGKHTVDAAAFGTYKEVQYYVSAGTESVQLETENEEEKSTGYDFSVSAAAKVDGLTKPHHTWAVKGKVTCQNGKLVKDGENEKRERDVDWEADVLFKTKVDGADVGAKISLKTHVIGLSHVLKVNDNTKFTTNYDFSPCNNENNKFSFGVEME